MLVVRASPLLSLVVVFGMAGVPTTPATAGWSSAPIPVRPTTASIPAVAACNDGGFGTFVAWQEEATSGSGVVRVQHLLPTGDLDPAWSSDGAVACDVVAQRAEAGLLPDHLGGCYVWWTEVAGANPALYVNRLDSGGAVATGWPARGLSFGSVSTQSPRPSLIEDGVDGIFVAWSQVNAIRGHHLGPDGLGAAGWPNSGRVLLSSPATVYCWPDLALAPDGGVYFAWAAADPDTLLGSGLFLRRLSGAGANVSGWPLAGNYVGSFRYWAIPSFPRTALLDIAPDGRGGVFVFAGSLWEDPGGWDYADLFLHRFRADGQVASDWPAQGRRFLGQDDLYFYDNAGGPDAGIRVHSDGLDGAVVEARNFYSDAPAITRLVRCTFDGQWSSLMEGVTQGHDLVIKGDGGAYMADYKPIGPSSPWDWYAFIQVDQSLAPPSWNRLIESHDEAVQHWFGDIALASSGDGAAVFFWSQNIDRFGLFARRFSPAGEVTGVAPATTSLALHGLRFLSGAGVLARVGLPGGPARLDLFDISGRRLASRSIAGAGVIDVWLPGTAALPSGVYFGRLVSGAGVASSKVAITR